MLTTSAILFAIAFLVSLIATPLVRRAACHAGVVDVPDGGRKLHSGPIPRLGGIAVVLAVCAALLVTLSYVGGPGGTAAFARGMVIPSLIIVAVGILDDLWSVRPSVKLAFQIAAALWVFYVLDIRIDLLANPFGGESVLGALSLPATILWIVLVTNAFNIVDGMDGLAAGVAFIAAVCALLVSLQLQNAEVAFFAAPLAGATLGFLKYNFNPASIFLGDTGSLFLGFQLAVLSIAGSQKSSTAISIVVPLFMLALPLIETTVSMTRRYLRGEPIMQPDRGHIHHQLLRLGLTPKRAVLLMYLGSALFGMVSLFMVQRDGTTVALATLTLAVVTWMGIQRLGYAEFQEINDAFKRSVLHQRRTMQHNLHIRKLAEDLQRAGSLEAARDLLASAAAQLGFSRLTLRCGGPAELLAARERDGLSESDLTNQTVMSIVLAGATGEVGEVVLARSKKARPLHSELTVLVEAITSTLPSIIERTYRAEAVVAAAMGGAHRDAAALAGFAALAPAHTAIAEAGEAELACTQACHHCGAHALTRSRSRSFAERLRKVVSRKRLHRCSACGWRGWELILVQISTEPPAADTSIDLGRLDRLVPVSGRMQAAV
jgi:UDP-GlcNAc:undecaprenyl-phosphate GlcNAc-1-phosphate transferase